MCFVQREQPLGVRVPLAQPRRAIGAAGNVQLRIFEDLQRQTRLPAYVFELKTPARILREIADRQIPKVQLAVRAGAREYQRLTIGARIYPDYVRINVVLVKQRREEIG